MVRGWKGEKWREGGRGMWEVEVKGWEEEGWWEVRGCGGGRMWRWEDVEAGGCGDVGETMEKSRFFIHQIHTHTLKTYTPPHFRDVHSPKHTHTHYTHSPSQLIPQPLLLKTVVWS